MGMIEPMQQMPRTAPSIAALYHIIFLPSSALEADAAQWYRRQVSVPVHTSRRLVHRTTFFSGMLHF